LIEPILTLLLSVPEVPDSGEQHRESQAVGGCDYFGIAL
jgi:hypothetical protein